MKADQSRRRVRLDHMTADEVMTPSGESNHHWTTGDLAFLRANSSLGAQALSDLMERSLWSVKNAAHRHRISLRRTGSRRGAILGQPRGCSVCAELRSDVMTGKVDQELLARRVEVERHASMCPDCGRRPAQVAKSGLCRICHSQRLSEAHLEQLDELDSRRALWSSRQALHRARVEVEA